MKKIICFTLCLILAICAPSCSDEPTALSAPALTLSESGNATWAPQEGAIGYEYKINDGTPVRVDASVKGITIIPGESICVRALGDGVEYLDSEWSAPIKNENPQTLPKPVLETTTIGNQIIISWERDARATSYKIRINGGDEQEISENQYMITINDTFRLQAVGDGERYLNSYWAIVSPTPTH